MFIPRLEINQKLTQTSNPDSVATKRELAKIDIILPPLKKDMKPAVFWAAPNFLANLDLYPTFVERQ